MMQSIKNLNKKHLLGAVITLTVIFIFILTTPKNWIRLIHSEITTAWTQRAYDPNQIVAASAIVYDQSNGKILFSKHEKDPQPIASLTKVITAYTALKIESVAKEKHIVPITAENLSTDGESYLVLGETWNLDNLIEFMLMASSNDAAEAIANSFSNSNAINRTGFIQTMNKQAQRLNLKSFQFNSPSGLDSEISGTPRAVGSAIDVAHIMIQSYIEFPAIFGKTAQESAVFYSQQGIEHKTGNTNSSIPNLKHLRASKTGYTLQADGNLAIIIEPEPNHLISIVVLGSTKEARFSDVEYLARVVEADF